MNARELRFLVVGLLLGSAGLYAVAAVSLPNTFSPGSTIKASEVNANFSALKTAVDSLESGKVGFSSTLSGSSASAGFEVSNAGTGPGVKVKGSTALELDGAIRVSGNKAAFLVAAVNRETNLAIDNPLVNGDPNAMIFLTPQNNFGGIISVDYKTKTNQWVIYCDPGVQGGYCPNAYNVLVIKQ